MQKTLLLNAGFEPLRVVSWQRAFSLIFQGKVEILEEYGAKIHTVSEEFKVPAVIRMRRWVNLKKHAPVIRFSRANVYARDDYRCQYCYVCFSEKDLTLDHVHPVVHGGKKTWDNIVTACIRCNQKKGHRSVEEVGFIIFKQPRRPHWLPGILRSLRAKEEQEAWAPYLSSNHSVTYSEK
jgi:5-methylcytosine-specific restriction endonuclease McrA